MNKIKFSDLSWPVKIGILGGLANAVFYALAFLIGFVNGILAS